MSGVKATVPVDISCFRSVMFYRLARATGTLPRMDRRSFLTTTAAAMPAMHIAARHRALAATSNPSDPLTRFSTSAAGWTIPRPMYWSFDNRDPRIEMAGYSLSFQVFTNGPIENTFSLDAHSIMQQHEGNRWTMKASRLSWPGQQQPADGSFTAEAVVDGDIVTLRTTATAVENIRCIKVRVHRLPAAAFGHTGWQVTPNFAPVTPEGVTSNYPAYTGGMPVWFLGNETRGIAFSCLDPTHTPKRFGAQLQGDGIEAQLIVEQDAMHLSPSFEAPAWQLRRNTTIGDAINAHMQLLEREAGLKRWEDRTDVPPWAREIDLVVTLHGMHWSGYIFNDYGQMLESVRWVTDRIAGKRVLFFLAGWEGRYYRQYGDSRPDDRMGSADGLRRLVQGTHERGAHVMAMFAGNGSDMRLPGFAQWGADSGFHALPGGLDWSPMRGYQVDWAEIRAGVEGGVWLNPGAPGWRDHLIHQVGDLNATYGFDGNFFDTQPSGDNDLRYNPLAGLRSLADALRSRKPDLLLATESWFDLSLPIIPMSQTPDGPTGWSRRYQRRFAHLSLGEPSRGSTGVHELGFVPYDLSDLLDTFDLPTVSFVENTYQSAPQKVEAVIAAAKKASRAISAGAV